MREFFKIISFCTGIIVGVGIGNYFKVLLAPQKALEWIAVGAGAFLVVLFLGREWLRQK